MDKVNNVVTNIVGYTQAMINTHYVAPELVWLQLKTECESKLDQLAELDTPDFDPS